MPAKKFLVLDQDLIFNGVPIRREVSEFLPSCSLVLCVLFENMHKQEFALFLEDSCELYDFQIAARLFLFSDISFFVISKEEAQKYKKTIYRSPVLFLTRMKTLKEISEEGG